MALANQLATDAHGCWTAPVSRVSTSPSALRGMVRACSRVCVVWRCSTDQLKNRGTSLTLPSVVWEVKLWPFVSLKTFDSRLPFDVIAIASGLSFSPALCFVFALGMVRWLRAS